jgi:CubicO group peptidase (beta-lactamase class C family)
MNAHSSVSGSWLAVLLLVQVGTCTGSPAAGPQVVDLAADLTAVRTEYAFPAVAAAVIVDGKLHAVGVVGVRKQGNDIAAEPNDPFHLGSCTKAMTGSLICLLVQQGKLKWDTPLPEYFPELKDKMHPDYRQVTLVHLLSHRAGIPPMTNGFAPLSNEQLKDIQAMTPPAQRKAMTEIVLCQPPVCKPGEKQLYSNAGFSLAGVIAERVLGEDYETLLRRMLFEPLKMSTAGFGAMGESYRIFAPWQHRSVGGQLVPISPGPGSDNPPFITPAGRVHCSITDWAKYIQCVLTAARGQEGFLPQAEIQQLKEPPFGGGYTLGWGITERDWAGGKVFQHAGSNGGNFCVVWIAPLRNFALLTATNCGGDKAAEGLDRICSALIKKFLPQK